MWGSIISAGASLVGGLLANRSRDNAAEENAALQREMAQNSVRWRVEDAKAAGIHPIFAMGANLPSASPVLVGDDGFAQGLANAGQDIGRAIDATRTAPERVDARMEALALERGELENEFLRSKIAREKAQIGPPMPVSPAGYDSPAGFPTGDVAPAVLPVEVKPLERTAWDEHRPWQEPAALSDVGFVRTPTGLAPVPSKDAKDRIEDQMIPELMWSLRNNLVPTIGDGTPPPQHWLPQGAIRWQWNPFRQEWQPEFLGAGTKFNGPGRRDQGPVKW